MPAGSPGLVRSGAPDRAKRRFIRILASLAVGLTLTVGSGEATRAESADETSPAQAALQRAAEPFLRLHTFKAEFVQTQEWVGMDDPSFFRGVLYLERPNKFRKEYSEPAGTLQLCDGETVYTYVPENEQVLAVTLPRDGRADILGRILEESVAHPEVAEADLDGIAVRILTLDPPDGLELESVRLWTRSDSGAILQYELNELSGNRDTYRLIETWSDPKLDPNLFQFEPPKGVPVVEVG
ncbi:MAG: outer membrane lipoprotein carrier protein LolA [Candidatus Eisenbacteria bacterium]|nr:outer membrane lipoprotein carrier protein LolA [Candidatus Eisenbacteria bacterium]